MELLLNIEIDSITQTNVSDVAGNTYIESPQTGINVAKLTFHRQNDANCLTLKGVFLVVAPILPVSPMTPLRIRISPTFVVGDIQDLVSSCEIELTQEDLDSQNLESIIYNKVADKLNTEYGWSIVVA